MTVCISAESFFEWIRAQLITAPVVLNFKYNVAKEDLVIKASMECGAFAMRWIRRWCLAGGHYEVDLLASA